MRRVEAREQISSAGPAARWLKIREEAKKTMVGLNEDVVKVMRPHRHNCKGLATQMKKVRLM